MSPPVPTRLARSHAAAQPGTQGMASRVLMSMSVPCGKTTVVGLPRRVKTPRGRTLAFASWVLREILALMSTNAVPAHTTATLAPRVSTMLVLSLATATLDSRAMVWSARTWTNAHLPPISVFRIRIRFV